jgi:hypothetical protein
MTFSNVSVSTTINQIMLHIVKCWSTKRLYVQQLSTANMCMLCEISGGTCQGDAYVISIEMVLTSNRGTDS